MTDHKIIEKLLMKAWESGIKFRGKGGEMYFDEDIFTNEAAKTISNHYAAVIAEKDKEIYQRDLAIKLGDEKSSNEITNLQKDKDWMWKLNEQKDMEIAALKAQLNQQTKQ